MSTEKSLLSWYQVKDKLVPVNEMDHLCIPVGISWDEKVKYVVLDESDENQHVCLIGKTGSGKSTALTWILTAMQLLYADKLGVSYYDGKGSEYKGWIDNSGKSMFSNTLDLKYISDYEQMHDTLLSLHYRLCNKIVSSPEIIVFDEVDHLMQSLTPTDMTLWKAILEIAPHCNAHMLYASQRFCEPTKMFERMGDFRKWKAVCITRTDVNTAKLLQGSEMAAVCVRKYGDLVLDSGDSLEKLRVPFVSKHDVYNALCVNKQ